MPAPERSSTSIRQRGRLDPLAPPLASPPPAPPRALPHHPPPARPARPARPGVTLAAGRDGTGRTLGRGAVPQAPPPPTPPRLHRRLRQAPRLSGRRRPAL